MVKKKFFKLKANYKYAKRKDDNEKIDKFRDLFNRDRDRILYSKSFRRLQGKTQVFVNSFDDHLRNRLTHTIEVSQISTTISKNLGLNIFLTEAIALGHDLGHTPFGHIGERILNLITNNCDKINKYFKVDENNYGFKHNLQSIKVLTDLTRISSSFKGLNLTNYTLWGILNHSKKQYKECEYHKNDTCNFNRSEDNNCKNKGKFKLNHYDKYINEIDDNESWTFEALIVAISDEIAQRHHDIEDGIIAGIIDQDELIEKFKAIFDKKDLEKIDKNFYDSMKSNDSRLFLHDFSCVVIRMYIKNLIENSIINLNNFIKNYSIKKESDFNSNKKDIFNKIKLKGIKKIISFSEDFAKKDKKFKNFLYNKILNSYLAQIMDSKAAYLIRKIIKAYLSNPSQLPDETVKTLFINFIQYKIDKYNKKIEFKFESIYNIGKIRKIIKYLYARGEVDFISVLIRTIVDFVSGMTDIYALKQYKMLYGTEDYWII